MAWLLTDGAINPQIELFTVMMIIIMLQELRFNNIYHNTSKHDANKLNYKLRIKPRGWYIGPKLLES